MLYLYLTNYTVLGQEFTRIGVEVLITTVYSCSVLQCTVCMRGAAVYYCLL